MNKLAYKGANDSEGVGALLVGVFVVAIIVAIVIIVAMAILYAGAAVGAWYSIRNYLRSFKVNVIDSNSTVAYA